jgi:hypothetical protein
MSNAEAKRRWRAHKRGEVVPYVKPGPLSGTYKWPADRVSSWVGEGNGS